MPSPRWSSLPRPCHGPFPAPPGGPWVMGQALGPGSWGDGVLGRWDPGELDPGEMGVRASWNVPSENTGYGDLFPRVRPLSSTWVAPFALSDCIVDFLVTCRLSPENKNKTKRRDLMMRFFQQLPLAKF